MNLDNKSVKNCPCCKGDATCEYLKPPMALTHSRVRCKECGLKTPYEKNIVVALGKWNRRADDE